MAEEKFPLRAVLNRVIIEALVPKEKTKSGIILAASAREEAKQGRGIARAVGPGFKNEEMQITPGDIVFLSPHAGQNLEIDDLFSSEDARIGRTYKTVDQTQIHSFVSPEDKEAYANVLENYESAYNEN